ncbi:MAG: hypothetical protein IT245_05605, partial [Bacteroidia bacterium]|nr:hypothetical protein [Bacteroidia bacterium]
GEPDTATYIAPMDTITVAPKFENGDQDFFRYIETHITLLNIGSSLTYLGGNYKFSFYIEKNGELSEFKMLTFSDANIAHELERVISRMPKWSTGYFQGKKKKTLMVYNVNLRKIDDFNAIEVTLNESDIQYNRSTNPLKWSLAIGSVLILIGLFIVRGG